MTLSLIDYCIEKQNNFRSCKKPEYVKTDTYAVRIDNAIINELNDK